MSVPLVENDNSVYKILVKHITEHSILGASIQPKFKMKRRMSKWQERKQR